MRAAISRDRDRSASARRSRHEAVPRRTNCADFIGSLLPIDEGARPGRGFANVLNKEDIFGMSLELCNRHILDQKRTTRLAGNHETIGCIGAMREQFDLIREETCAELQNVVLRPDRPEVNDRIIAQSGPEDEGIWAIAAGQNVNAGASIEDIGAVAAAQRIVAITAFNPVITIAAIQVIVAGTTDEHVDPVSASQQVIAYAATELVIAITAVQRVVTATAGEDVLTIATVQRVVVSFAVKAVITVATVEGIVPIASIKRIQSVTSSNLIVAGLTVVDVVASSTQEHIVARTTTFARLRHGHLHAAANLIAHAVGNEIGEGCGAVEASRRCIEPAFRSL